MEKILEKENLLVIDPTEGPVIRVDISMTDKVMKSGKALEPPGITAEMLKIPGGVGDGLVFYVVNQIIQEKVIPGNWCSIIVVSC